MANVRYFWVHLVAGRYMKRYTRKGGRCQIVEDNNEQVKVITAISIQVIDLY